MPRVRQASAQAPPAAALATDWPCLAAHGNAVRLAVSVSPNARQTRLDGLHDGALRVRLAAPPVDGKANEMLLAFVADGLGLPRRAVSLWRGASSRRKWLAIDAPPAAVARWLHDAAAAADPPP